MHFLEKRIRLLLLPTYRTLQASYSTITDPIAQSLVPWRPVLHPPTGDSFGAQCRVNPASSYAWNLGIVQSRSPTCNHTTAKDLKRIAATVSRFSGPLLLVHPFHPNSLPPLFCCRKSPYVLTGTTRRWVDGALPSPRRFIEASEIEGLGIPGYPTAAPISQARAIIQERLLPSEPLGRGR
jgi:hypothetical protein